MNGELNMKKEYVKPEAETIEFSLEETIMNGDEDDFGDPGGSLGTGGDFDW